jgi:hypothetical protein
MTGFLWENTKERDNLKDLGGDERMILKRLFRKYVGRVWTAFIWLKIDRIASCC